MKLWISKQDFYDVLCLVGSEMNHNYSAAIRYSDDENRCKQFLKQGDELCRLFHLLKKRGGFKDDIKK